MTTYEPNLVINLTTGQVKLVPLTVDEVAARDAYAAAQAALPAPIDPVADVVAQVINAPDFATAKTNLALYIAKRKAA